MKLSDLPDDFTPDQFMQLNAESLEQVSFTVVRWQCKIKLCKCFTRLRDYGLDPLYYSKRGIISPDGKVIHWVNTREIFLICRKHKKYWGKPTEDIPLKRAKNGGIIWGGDETKKEPIIY